MEYTAVLAKVSFFLIKVPKMTSLRPCDLAKIGHIAYPQHMSMGLGIEILWYQFGKICNRIEGEIAF